MSEPAARAPIIQVEKLVPGGCGFGRLDSGEVLLVQGVLPGERLLVTATRRASGVTRVVDYQLLNTSERRVQPRCADAARCGGCDWMHLEKSAQKTEKIAILREALRRTGKFSALPVPIEFRSSKSAYAYRQRLRLQVTPKGQLGFFSRRSHELVAIKRCEICEPELWQAVVELRSLAEGAPSLFRAVRHLELRQSDSFPHLGVLLTPRNGAGPCEELRDYLEQRKPDWRFVVETTADRGPSHWQRYTLSGQIYTYAPLTAFTQVNWPVNRLLVKQVVEEARTLKPRRFLDLFAGVGNFTLPLLAAGIDGTAVEANATAMAAARRAAREQSLGGEFLTDDAYAGLKRCARDATCFDLVVVDPPRAGLTGGVTELSRVARSDIAMCSCDPVTLARDIRLLTEAGFGIRRITCFDMFPQTHHQETLVWLERRDAGNR